MQVFSKTGALLSLLTLLSGAVVACDKEGSSGVEAVAVDSAGTASTAPRASRASNYSARLDNPQLQAGAEESVQVVIRPGRGLKINEDFPWQFRFSAVDGLGLQETTVSQDGIRLEEMAATIALPLGELRPGTYTIEATGNFSVCNDDRCDILRNERLDFEVEVSEPNRAPKEDNGP
jgi:hypothetical protein